MVRIIILQGCFLAFIKLSAKTKGFFFPKGQYLRKNQRLRHKTKTTCTEEKKNQNKLRRYSYPCVQLKHTRLRNQEQSGSHIQIQGKKRSATKQNQQLKFWILQPDQRATLDVFKLKIFACNTSHRANQEHTDPKTSFTLRSTVGLMAELQDSLA